MSSFSKFKEFFSKKAKKSEPNLSYQEKWFGFSQMNNEGIIKVLSAYRDYYRDRTAKYLKIEDQKTFEVYDDILKKIVIADIKLKEIPKQKEIKKVRKDLRRDNYNQVSSGII
jgi:hypothetical protein